MTQPRGDLPDQLLMPGEVERDLERFEGDPVLIILKFLTCFDATGRQAYRVPSHVLEALAQRFLSFKLREAKTLDAAFGGRTGQRVRAIVEREEDDQEIIWEVTVLMQELKGRRPELNDGQLREQAFSIVAEREKCTPANVRRIWDKHEPKRQAGD